MGTFEMITQSLKKYADFKGRASRAEFWTFFFFVLIAQAVARLVDTIFGGGYLGGPVAMLTGLLLFVPQVSVAIRRLHDVNRSGRELLVPCLLLLASPLLVLFGSFLGKRNADDVGQTFSRHFTFGEAQTLSLEMRQHSRCF